MISTPGTVRDDHSGPSLTVTRGLPGSGKTTWALNELANRPHGTIARVNRDDLRRMLHHEPRYDPHSEAIVTDIQHYAITVLLTNGISVIADDTNLNNTHLASLKQLADMTGADFQEQDFRHIPLEVCIARDNNRTLRGGHVGEQVIRDMHARHLSGVTHDRT